MRFILIISIIHLSINLVVAQNDTIKVKNGIVLTGNVKNFERDIFTIETDFSDNDIRIDWDDINSISTQSNLVISDGDGYRHYGRIGSFGKDSLLLVTNQNEQILLARSDIVFMEQIEESFKDRLFFSIDVGFSMTQANNLKQWTSRSKAGYKADNWILEGQFNGLTSSQDETETIYRWDRNMAFLYILPRNWLINPEVSFFSSTEQKIDLRIVPRLGGGKILVRSSIVMWNVTGGLNMNFEDYSGMAEDRRSVEGFLGTELNLYDIKDIDFYGEFFVYPSLTEDGRWRYDLTLDFKYDLPFGFYLTTGYTYNFDNKPTEGANGTDFILNVGIGWSW